MDLVKTSKFMSLILRHKPEAAGVTLDVNGWVGVTELINGMNKAKNLKLTLDDIKEIVISDNKQRYAFNADFSKIRANQGHSVNVDVELKEAVPPDILYHGTADRFVDAIKLGGLRPQSRLYVHLASDIETAVVVGRRHGEPVVLEVAAGAMTKEGFKFYLSENGVWLTETVPEMFIKVAGE